MTKDQKQTEQVTDEREAFEKWGKSEGLIQESFGIRSVSSMCDVAWLSWQARAALSQVRGKAQEPKGYVRYCFHCGSIGEVEKRFRDCCPDGNTATYVREEVAEQAKLGFKQMVAEVLKDAAAPQSDAQHSIAASTTNQKGGEK